MGCMGSNEEKQQGVSVTPPASKPTLHYFDVSGRGELTKLIAAVGGVEMDFVEYPFKANGASVADKLKAGKMESEHTKAATAMGMDGCGLPILVHGDLKINQSAAVQRYVASIGPNYPTVTPAQKALDDMFEGALEDMMGLAAGVILSGGDPANVSVYMEKTLTHLSKYIKKEGFINGHAAPSKADLVILVLTQALVPFGATLGGGAAECYGKFPDAVALGERTAAFPAVAKWLDNAYCNLKKPPKADRPPEETKLTIHYFAGLRSRGEVVRMVAAYGSVQHELDLMSMEAWGAFKEEQAKLEPVGMQTLPYVTKPDGSLMGETCDVMKYLAELGGDAFVIDDATYKLAERANAPPFSLADPYLNLPDPAREQSGFTAPPEQVLADLAEGFKTVAGELGDKNFFAGEKPGYGEVYIFHNINNALMWKGAELEEAVGEEAMKPLKAFHDRFSELPGIKEYLAARPKECGMPGSIGNPA